MDALFSPSIEKLKRARSKFDGLKDYISNYTESQPYQLRVQNYGDSIYVIARLNIDPPNEISWEIVELMGHLRSALDKLIVGMVEHNGRGTASVSFPFGGLDEHMQPRPFPDPRMARLIGKLTDDQWSVIECHKPYPGGNSVLWAVNEIANEDKHRKDLVSVKAQLDQSSSFGSPNGGDSIIHHAETYPKNRDFLLKDKDRETVLLSLSGYNLSVEHRATTQIVFNNLHAVHGCNVVPIIEAQISFISKIIEDFKKLY